MWGGNTEPGVLWHLAHHFCSRPCGGGGQQSSAQTDFSSSTPPGDGAGLETCSVSLLLVRHSFPSRKPGSLPVPLGSKEDHSDPRPSDGAVLLPLPNWELRGWSRGQASPLLSYPNSLTLLRYKTLAKAFNGYGTPEASDWSCDTAIRSNCPAGSIKGAYGPLCTHIDLEVLSERCMLSTSN